MVRAGDVQPAGIYRKRGHVRVLQEADSGTVHEDLHRLRISRHCRQDAVGFAYGQGVEAPSAAHQGISVSLMVPFPLVSVVPDLRNVLEFVQVRIREAQESGRARGAGLIIGGHPDGEGEAEGSPHSCASARSGNVRCRNCAADQFTVPFAKRKKFACCRRCASGRY